MDETLFGRLVALGEGALTTCSPCLEELRMLASLRSRPAALVVGSLALLLAARVHATSISYDGANRPTLFEGVDLAERRTTSR